MKLVVVCLLAACAYAASVTYQNDNPYVKYTKLYINDEYSARIDNSSEQHPDLKSKFDSVKKNPMFIWLDKMAMIPKLKKHLEAAQKQGALIQIVVYDLPNRDCAALASNGELLVADDGLNKYKTQYIDPLAKMLNAYTNVPVVMVMEPDSLPNLVTNLGVPKCSEANTAYREGTAYAIDKLSAKNRYIYIDAAHECWLGWPNNMDGFRTVIQDLLTRVRDTTSLRGFATNVANYQNVHANSGDKDCGGYNPIPDEARYVPAMVSKMSGVWNNPGFILDTGRDGAHNLRSDPGNWCNIRGSGIGPRPVASGDGQINGVDAFVWVKPPGESDGTTDTSSPRYDAHCGSVDSLTNAPEAGEWFDSMFVDLVNNAYPPL